MSVAAQYIPAAYSLTAVGAWGASDFLGGVGARRVNAFLFTAIVHISGLVVVATLALITHAPFPGNASLVWALIAGSLGGIALALFYRSLASGNMGLVAPVAAVLGAAIPTIVTAFAEGFPGYRHMFGFVLAGIGVWLISRTEAGAGRPAGIGMAVLAGIGFAGFYLCIHQTGNASHCGSPPARGPLPCWSRDLSFCSEDTSARCRRRCWPLLCSPEFSTSPAPPRSSARVKSGAWTRRSCSVRCIPLLPSCSRVFFYTSTSAAHAPSACLRRWRRCR